MIKFAAALIYISCIKKMKSCAAIREAKAKETFVYPTVPFSSAPQSHFRIVLFVGPAGLFSSMSTPIYIKEGRLTTLLCIAQCRRKKRDL